MHKITSNYVLGTIRRSTNCDMAFLRDRKNNKDFIWIDFDGQEFSIPMEDIEKIQEDQWAMDSEERNVRKVNV